MKKRITICVSLLAALLFAMPAGAMEYTIYGANGGNFGVPTSIDTVSVGVRGNTDRSKDAALVPLALGSPSAGYASMSDSLAVGAAAVGEMALPAILYTAVSPELYYADGSIGELSIPSIGVNVRIYEGTTDVQLAKGVGHFECTSVWKGNVALAGHNRGVNSYFGRIHTLAVGGRITLTTRLGTRTYAVTEVRKIDETDSSVLSASAADCLTLITCVRGQSDYRWCVRASAT